MNSCVFTVKYGRMHVTYFWSTDFCTYCAGWLCLSVWAAACIFTPLVLCILFMCHLPFQCHWHKKFTWKFALLWSVSTCRNANTAKKLTQCRIHAWTVYWLSWIYEECVEGTVEILRCKSILLHTSSLQSLLISIHLVCLLIVCQNA
jgi:hypothetical protein